MYQRNGKILFLKESYFSMPWSIKLKKQEEQKSVLLDETVPRTIKRCTSSKLVAGLFYNSAFPKRRLALIGCTVMPEWDNMNYEQFREPTLTEGGGGEEAPTGKRVKWRMFYGLLVNYSTRHNPTFPYFFFPQHWVYTPHWTWQNHSNTFLSLSLIFHSFS